MSKQDKDIHQDTADPVPAAPHATAGPIPATPEVSVDTITATPEAADTTTADAANATAKTTAQALKATTQAPRTAGETHKTAAEAPQATTKTKNKAPKATSQVAPDKEESREENASDEPSTLKQVIEEQAIEGEAPFARNFTLTKILGGDILSARPVRRQIWVILLVAFFLVLYIANRYSVQQDYIEIDKLQKELQDAKYKALSTGSQLTEQSRESYVLQRLKNNKDSVLKMPTQPPYIINVPNE